jgi:hypothetical protein
MGTDPKEKQKAIRLSPLERIAVLSLALGLGTVAVFYIDEPIVQGLIGLHFLTMIIATFVYFGKVFGK